MLTFVLRYACLVALVLLNLTFAAKVIPMQPHNIDHSIVVRRELAKRGQLYKLDKSERRRGARGRMGIIERYWPDFEGPPALPGMERGQIPPLDGRTTHDKSRHGKHHRRQGHYLISGVEVSDGSSLSASSPTSIPSAGEQAIFFDNPASSTVSASIVETSASSSNLIGPLQLLDVSASASESTVSTTSSAPPSPSTHYIDSIPLDPGSGIAYTIEVRLGAEGTLVPLLIDTGSTIFWAASKNCATCQTAGMIQAVDAPDSAEAGQPLTYGTGKVISSKQIKTLLDLGEITLPDYDIYAATEVDVVLQHFGFFLSGIFGMGLSPGNTPDSPIDRLYDQGSIASPLIGFYLARASTDDNSQIVIGDPFNIEDTDLHIDFSKRANLTQRVTDSSHYNVLMDDFKIHGMSLNGMQGLTVIVDSGSTNLFLPEEYIDGIFKTIGNGTTWTVDISGRRHVVPCGLYPKEAEILSIVFEGVEFGVQWQDIAGLPAPGYPDWCIARVSTSPIEGLFLIGDAFLINVFHTVNTQTGEVTFYGYKPAE